MYKKILTGLDMLKPPPRMPFFALNLYETAGSPQYSIIPTSSKPKENDKYITFSFTI